MYKLDKGEYTIKMHVRHERRELLEKIVDLPIQLVQKLQNSLSLDVYNSHHQATIFGKKSSNFIITPSSDWITLNIGSLPNEKYVYKNYNKIICHFYFSFSVYILPIN